MSILTNMQNSENMSSENKELSKNIDNEVTGVHNAIRSLVEAKRGQSASVDKGKRHGILASALKSVMKRKK